MPEEIKPRHRPSDAEVNRLCALACGWERCSEKNPAYCKPLPHMNEMAEIIGMNNPNVKTYGWMNKQTLDWQYSFNDDFCQDRNALPKLWQAIEQTKNTPLFMHVMGSLTGSCDCFDVVKAEPRLHAIAALKALDKWPDGWEEE